MKRQSEAKLEPPISRSCLVRFWNLGLDRVFALYRWLHHQHTGRHGLSRLAPFERIHKPEGWLENEDMMAEHSHRLLGAVMGLLSIGLCVTAHMTNGSQQLKKLGIALVILVVTQGLLGGLRVKLDALNLQIDHNLYAQSFAVVHATFAQIFL